MDPSDGSAERAVTATAGPGSAIQRNLPLNTSSRDIAGEAFQGAIKYLEQEFEGNATALLWLKTATTTSLKDLVDTTRQLETRYAKSHSGKNGFKSWVRGLSQRIMYYGQVLDTLAQHHPEYVSLVWGAIKFVLMGIISHGNLVVQFSRALSLIARALPRAEVSAELYQTDEMRDAVQSLYAHVLLFLQQAVRWYNVGRAGRAVTALFKPFELSYADIVEQITACSQTVEEIAAVAARCEIRDINLQLRGEGRRQAERERKLHDMQAKFETQQAELRAMMGTILQIVSCSGARLGEVQVDVREMKPRVLDMHFHTVLSILKPRRMPEDALERNRAIVRRASPWRQHQDRTMAELLRAVGEWITAPLSSLLVLQTQPRAQTRVKEIATELINLLRPQSAKVIWYLSSTGFETDPDTGQEVSVSASTVEVLKSLVFQSMRLAPDLVRSEPGTFSAEALHAPHSEDEWLELLCGILRGLRTCFVIIEAEDVFKGYEHDDREEARVLIRLVGKLNARFKEVAATEEKKTAVKLLVVSYGEPVRWEEGEATTSNVTVLPVHRELPVPPRLRKPGMRSAFRGTKWRNMAAGAK